MSGVGAVSSDGSIHCLEELFTFTLGKYPVTHVK